MPHTIAVAGKGGVGKTTTCGMLIDHLCKKRRGPVLVVDADANSNLNEVLGVEVETSLGAIREEMAQAELKGSIPKGMTKADYAEMKFNDALIEDDDFDMLVMGRTQGKGCYCYVNGVLQSQVAKYAKNYSYIVMDNEAGLEHIARGTLPHVDTMLLISDCSRRGIQAVARIAEMVDEMGLNPGQMGLIVNRAPGGVLKSQVDKYAKNYAYIVMDNEAGLEHVARGTLPHVDTMLLISDCSRRGIQAAARVAEMVEEMELHPGKMGLIVNRAPGGVLEDGVKEEIEKHGLTLFGVLPHDEAVYRCDCNGEPSAKLPESDPMKNALKGIMAEIGL